MVRLSYQHRAFYCYVILSVWIFLLVAGMYKYIGIDEKSSMQTRVLGNDISIREFPRNLRADVKTKKIFRFCNPPNDITAETEGILNIIVLAFLCKTICMIMILFSLLRKIGWESNIRRYLSIYSTR